MAISSNNSAIIDAVQTALANPICQGRFVCVALSGGVDSMVLCHALNRLGVSYRAIHVNHGLQSDADRWEGLCAEVCQRWSVEFESVRLHLAQGGNVEARAREARYQALFQAMPADAVLLTAHHADDQLETGLLRWLRGSGLRGLAGIRPSSTRSGREILRPLLSVSRAQIESYAREHQLSWAEDPSNQSEQFDRNFIRHTVVPALKTRWSDVASRIQNSAQLVQEDAQAYEYLLQQQLKQRQDGEKLEISDAPIEVECRILQVWLNQWGVKASNARLTEFIRQTRQAPSDRMPQLSFEQGDLYFYDGFYWFEALNAFPKWQKVRLVRKQSDLRPVRMRLTQLEDCPKVKVKGQANRRALRQIFKQSKVPPWRRAQMPVLLIDGELASIGGIIDYETSSGFSLKCTNKVQIKHQNNELDSIS